MEYPKNATELARLQGKIIEFTEGVERTELMPNTGMRGRIVDYSVELAGTEDEHFNVLIDMSEFVEYNRLHMRANFYDANRVPCETWEESGLYPSNHRESCYMDWNEPVFKVIDDEHEVRDLIKRLWESDEASALTNEAARALEKMIGVK